MATKFEAERAEKLEKSKRVMAKCIKLAKQAKGGDERTKDIVDSYIRQALKYAEWLFCVKAEKEEHELVLFLEYRVLRTKLIDLMNSYRVWRMPNKM